MKKILCIIGMLVFAGNLMANQKPVERLPVETFYKNPDISDLRISPDGLHYAATVVIKGDKKLAVLDAKTKEIKAVYSFSAEKREIGRVGWFNSERVFATMVQKVGPLDQPAPTGYLFAASINGKSKIQLLPQRQRAGKFRESPRGYSFLSFLPDDDRHVLITMGGKRAVAYKLNVYTGAREKVESSPVLYSSLTADQNGKVRVVTAYDQDEELYSIYLKNTQTSDWELFKSYPGKKVGMRPIGFTGDNKKLLLNVRGDSMDRGIYSLDLETKELSSVYKIEGDSDIEGYIYDNNYGAREVIGIKRMPGYVTNEFFDKNNKIAQVHAALSKNFAGQQVDLVNYTKDNKTALLRVWSDKNPGTFYSFDLEKYNLEYLLDTLSWIDREKMAEMKPIKFNARDGLEIRGYLTLPVGKSKNLPLVVYVHGGPYGVKEDWGYNYGNRDTQFLANRGYAVLQLNYRGSGGRGSEFQYDAYKQMGAEMQNDLTDGTLWAVEQGYADKNRICIYGASYGGYASLMGVVKEPDLYKCAIPYVGLYDINLWKEADTYRSKYGRRFIDEAWGFDSEEFVKERSPIYHLDKLKAALFFVHGAEDPRVPIDNHEDVTEALTKMNYPFESLVKEHEGHGFRDEKNNYELYTKIEKFLDKHIGN